MLSELEKKIDLMQIDDDEVEPFRDVDLPFTIMEDCNLDYIEPISIVYKDRAFPLEHESDQGGGNEYHFYEKHDGNWSESLLLPDLLDKLIG